jgi:hypothetical protein
LDDNKSKLNKKSSKEYMKYAGLATSMFGTLFILWFIGSKIDAYFGNEVQYIGLCLMIMGLFAILYKIIKSLS